ncbi:MAG: type I-E CRISPR-associated protein Cse2/CasB [Oscillospiraceae bacterium]|nr:type I-E CRISPR-associated protein Cse2/CasB [Oscillospiraceae bacterium]
MEYNEIQGYVGAQITKLTLPTQYATATLAKLRRGIGKELGALPNLFEITVGGLPDNADANALNAIYTALTLFAVHQQGQGAQMSGRNSFGRACRALLKYNEEADKSKKRRFDAAATSADITEFANHARSLIGLLKAAAIPLDYPAFAVDLYKFANANSRNNVRLQWGRDFYKEARGDEDRNENEEKA